MKRFEGIAHPACVFACVYFCVCAGHGGWRGAIHEKSRRSLLAFLFFALKGALKLCLFSLPYLSEILANLE
jgi:hypothetical protein